MMASSCTAGPMREDLSLEAKLNIRIAVTRARRWSRRIPYKAKQDAANLDVPRDIASAGSVPVALEFSRLQYKLGLPVTVQVGSPLTWAGSICGEERLMPWLIKKPDLVHHVLRKITDFILAKTELWANEFSPAANDGFRSLY